MYRMVFSRFLEGRIVACRPMSCGIDRFRQAPRKSFVFVAGLRKDQAFQAATPDR